MEPFSLYEKPQYEIKPIVNEIILIRGTMLFDINAFKPINL